MNDKIRSSQVCHSSHQAHRIMMRRPTQIYGSTLVLNLDRSRTTKEKGRESPGLEERVNERRDCGAGERHEKAE